MKKKPLRKDDLLTFKRSGRSIPLSGLKEEFEEMKKHLSTKPTPDKAELIAERSGTHLLKLINPQADKDLSCLSFTKGRPGHPPQPILPSGDAKDIPYAKTFFRPLEIEGFANSRSIAGHLLDASEESPRVLSEFASVFGEDVLRAFSEVIERGPRTVTELPAGQFPIVFVPKVGGGDLQITPISPVGSLLGMSEVVGEFFKKAEEVEGPPARGEFHSQLISGKPANICGAVPGRRRRLWALMPEPLGPYQAALYRYLQGGAFPRFEDRLIGEWTLRYAEMAEDLSSEDRYSNSDMRAALDRVADRLINEATRFIAETLDEAGQLALKHGLSERSTQEISIPEVLLRRRWSKKEDFAFVRNAIFGSHFQYRLNRFFKKEGVAA